MPPGHTGGRALARPARPLLTAQQDEQAIVDAVVARLDAGGGRTMTSFRLWAELLARAPLRSLRRRLQLGLMLERDVDLLLSLATLR